MLFAPFRAGQAKRKRPYSVANIAGHVVFRIGTAAAILPAIMACNAIATAITAFLKHDA